MKFAEIGARIKALRLAKGLKQEDVAAALHTSRVNYTKMETGERDLKTEHCIALARFFGVSCDYILTGVEAEHLDIHNYLGLDENVIQILKDDNKKMRGTMLLNMVDTLNALLSPQVKAYGVLVRIFMYIYLDFTNPRTPFLNPDENLFSETIAFYLNEPYSKNSIYFPFSLDGDIFEEAFLETIKMDIRDCKRRVTRHATQDNP